MAYPANDRTQTGNGNGSSIADKATDLAEKASATIGSAIGGAEATARQLAERGSEAGEHVQEVAGNLKGAVDKSLKDQPMATLAIATMLGFALGALWKS